MTSIMQYNEYFTVLAKPNITGLCDLKVRLGEPCVLKTTVTGSPKPKVSWFLDNKPVDKGLITCEDLIKVLSFQAG